MNETAAAIEQQLLETEPELSAETRQGLASFKASVAAGQAQEGQKPERETILERCKERGKEPHSKSAQVIQFPLFPEEKRPVSNDIARSALFSCVQGKDRQMVKDNFLAAMDGVEIRFTGEQFNQDDHDLLMQLVFMAKHRLLGEYVTVPAHAVLKALGRKTDGREHERLRADIMRLVAGTVGLRNTTRKIEYIGHLIEAAIQDETSRFWKYKFNPDLRVLYTPNSYTLIEWEQRKNLKGKDLARWLQLYLSTHAVPFPVKVATLRELSGSRTGELYKFRQLLRGALADLKDNGSIKDWCIDEETDLVTVDRGKAISDSQRRHLTRPKRQKQARV
jgi:hypothetical protein